MMKSLISVVLALWTVAVTATAATTQTNVLQNITLQLTIYQQGGTNSTGKKVADQVTSYTTKSLIAALGAVTSQQFGVGAKLVQSTVYSNVTVTTGPAVYSTLLSTNLALATNSDLSVGGIQFFSPFNTMTISNDVIISGDFPGDIPTNVLGVVTAGATNQSVTIPTNALTTITPSTNTNGTVTNVLIVAQEQVAAAPTESVLTNVSSSIDVLYGGTANTLFPVNDYLSFSPLSPAEIVVETGSGLDTTNMTLASQNGFSIQGLQIGYAGAANLTLTLEGFVKQTLKVDTLYAHGTNRIVEDIFGANSTWNVVGYGYAGGTYITNQTTVPVLTGFLTNASPVVVEGSVNITFLKNLAQ